MFLYYPHPKEVPMLHWFIKESLVVFHYRDRLDNLVEFILSHLTFIGDIDASHYILD